ncbi:hypothetical protein V2J09_001154 [Rumex salicifolius]
MEESSSLCAVIVGEIANFTAYIYAPAVLVTPLGALSIIVRPVVVLNSSCQNVMSVKAIGIAIELTKHPPVKTLMRNFLNALDTFNTAHVSPIYYALFTSFTILASAIMFRDYSGQSVSSIASELCGFITVLSGTTILHSTREPDQSFITDLYTPLSPKMSWHLQSNGELWRLKDEDGMSTNFIKIIRHDYFK